MADPEVTEIKKLSVKRNDGVKSPANGTKFLFMKAVNAAGGIDEKPDIAGAESVLQQLAKLIQNEAAEMAVGSWDESYDIQLLSEAVCLMQCFLDREQWGDEDDGDGLAKGIEEFAKAHRKFSTDERKRLAAEGKALPDGSYPVPDVDALGRAATLARSKHGDWKAAERLVAKRAKELGVPNPLADDNAKKDAPETGKAGEGAEKDQETSASDEGQNDEGTPDVESLVKEAVAEAMKASEGRYQALEAELAKVKATPIPGGPAITVPHAVRADRERDEHLAKAIHYERLAEKVSENDIKKEYLAKARAARKAAGL